MWFRNESNITFVLAKMAEKNISVDLYIEINAYLSTSAYFNGQSISVPIAAINDIRQIESVLQELALEYNSSSKNTKESIHLPWVKEHINEVIKDLLYDNEHNSDTSELARLQFILGQLENTFIPKNRRRYNIITQIMAIKTHLISPACYKYLQFKLYLSSSCPYIREIVCFFWSWKRFLYIFSPCHFLL